MEEYLEKEIITEYVVKGFNALFTYVRGAVGFHRWSALKYFLFEYDSALQKKFGNITTKFPCRITPKLP